MSNFDIKILVDNKIVEYKISNNKIVNWKMKQLIQNNRKQ